MLELRAIRPIPSLQHILSHLRKKCVRRPDMGLIPAKIGKIPGGSAPGPKEVGLRPPGAARSPQPGSQGPKTSFGIMDLELFGPKIGFGEIEKQKGTKMGTKWAHLG